MAKIAFTLDVEYGPDSLPSTGEIDVWRLNEGTDSISGASVLPEKMTVPAVKAGVFNVLQLDPNVTYLFDVRRLGNTSVTKGVRGKTMPASGPAKFSTTADVIPVYPTVGILGDAMIDGVLSNPASDAYATLEQFVIDHPGPQGPTGLTGAPGGSDASFAGFVANPASATSGAVAAKIGTLKAWAKDVDNLIAGAITYSAGLISSAVVQWPDGVPGILTILTRQSGTDAVTSYKVTRVDGSTTTTYTQPTITRDSSGLATLVPQITVA